MVIDDVRLARPYDRPRLVEVSREAQTMFADYGLDLPEDCPNILLERADSVLVAGSPPDGFAAMITVDGHAHLEEMAVHPASGRKGLGSALLTAACELARRRGDTEITLTTFEAIPWNGPWYAQRGFRSLPEDEWGPELRALWEQEAPIQVAPRLVMHRPL